MGVTPMRDSGHGPERLVGSTHNMCHFQWVVGMARITHHVGVVIG